MNSESIDNIYKILAENQTIIMKNQADLADMKDFMYKLDKKIDISITEIKKVDKKIDNVKNELNEKIEKLDKKIDNVRNELHAEIKKVDTKIDNVRNELHAEIKKVDSNLSNFKEEVSDFFVNDIIPYINPNFEKRISYLESIAEAHGYSKVCEDEEDYNCD